MQSGQQYEEDGSAGGPRRLLDRLQWVLVALGIVLFFSLGWQGRNPIRLLGGDELTYLSVSHSLESGSYREIHLADAPRHIRYPPGYPAWLVAVRAVGGDSVDLIRAVNLALIAAAIVSAYLLTRHLAGIPIALAAFFLTAFNHTLLDVGGTLLSEGLFLALITGALLCTISTWRGAGYLATALALFAFLTRAAGITLLAAVGFWLWGRRRKGELGTFITGSLAVVGGWLAWSALFPGAQAGYSYRDDIVGGLRVEKPNVLLRMVQGVGQRVAAYGTEGLPWTLSFPTVPGTLVDNLLWLAACVVLLGAGVVVFWKRARPVAVFLVLYALLVLAWPWRIDRLLVPAVPLVIASLLIGADRLAQRLPPLWRRAAVASLVLLLGAGMIRGVGVEQAWARDCDLSDPLGSPACYDAESRSLISASRYLRAHAPPDAIVLTRAGTGVHYLSGLRAAPAELVEQLSPRRLPAELRQRGINYILVTGPGEFEQKRLGPALKHSCRDFRVAARFPPAGVLFTMEAPSDPAQDACGEIARLMNDSTPRSD